MTSSKILFYLCLAFIVGVALESVFRIPQFILWIFLFVAVFVIFASLLLFMRSHSLWQAFVVSGFCLMFLVLGVLRLQISEFNIVNDKLSNLNDTEQDIVLTGTIIKEPDLRERSQKLKIKTDNFNSTVLVTTSRYPEYNYLDKIKITGKLQTPMETEEFSYKNYLLKDHIYSVMYFSEIQPALQKPGVCKLQTPGFCKNSFYFGVLWVKQKMRQSIKNNFLPPYSSILRGVILGDKSAISQEVKDKFRAAGLSHIIAISGMHVAILGAIVLNLLLWMGLWRGQAFYVAVAFILLYVVLVGFPASAVRAGVMGIVYLLGQKIGRQTMSSRIIVLAASIMLLANPLLLFYDIGFQLSFLAVLGLILFEPIMKNFIKILALKLLKFEIKKNWEKGLSLFTVTISAQVFTLPIIVYNFGNVSLVSILTNVLILPIIPAVMFFGFLSAATGAVFGLLGWFLSVPCYFLLRYIFWIVDMLSGQWAFLVVKNVSWMWVVVCYLFLGFATRYLNKKVRTKFLDF